MTSNGTDTPLQLHLGIQSFRRSSVQLGGRGAGEEGGDKTKREREWKEGRRQDKAEYTGGEGASFPGTNTWLGELWVGTGKWPIMPVVLLNFLPIFPAGPCGCKDLIPFRSFCPAQQKSKYPAGSSNC